MDPTVFAALAEPNRLRIVELLAAAPRPVGEIARVLGLRQPQATKHLRTLAAAGLVTMHPLGRRRIYALRRERLRELSAWAQLFAIGHPSEGVLEQYRAAIDAEEELARRSGRTRGRTLTLERELPAAPPAVWRAWTSAELVRRWWSPRHFTVVECTVVPVTGGPFRVVMREGDGTLHRAAGRFLALTPPTTLTLELAPLGPDGKPLFAALYDLQLAAVGEHTRLTLSIRVPDAPADAAPLLAGMELGWEQLLDKLTVELT